MKNHEKSIIFHFSENFGPKLSKNVPGVLIRLINPNLHKNEISWFFQNFIKNQLFWKILVENVKFCKFSNNDNFWINYRINTLDTSLKSLGIIFFENKKYFSNSLDLVIFEALHPLGLTERAKNRKFRLDIPKAIIQWKIMKNRFFFHFSENFGHKLSKNVPGVLIRLLYPNLHKNEILYFFQKIVFFSQIWSKMTNFAIFQITITSGIIIA